MCVGPATGTASVLGVRNLSRSPESRQVGSWGEGFILRPLQLPHSFLLVSIPDVGRSSQQGKKKITHRRGVWSGQVRERSRSSRRLSFLTAVLTQPFEGWISSCFLE